jgi:hypothetical protein
MADGAKWFECQAYSSSRGGNVFGRVREGDLIFFGPSKTSSVYGAARVAAQTLRGIAPDVALAKLTPSLGRDDDERRHLASCLGVYFEGKRSVDFLSFDVVWDLRPQHLSWTVLFDRLELQPPTLWMGIPSPRGLVDVAKVRLCFNELGFGRRRAFEGGDSAASVPALR